MKILITGASGLVGQELIKYLSAEETCKINVLTRNKTKFAESCEFPVRAFNWDPMNEEIDSEALNDVEYIINLAGAGIADKRWTEKRKIEILKSRTSSTRLLLNEIDKLKVKPKKFINASAIGIYGDTDKKVDEKSKLGDGFLADVCKKWEEPIENWNQDETIKVILRIGLVLSSNGGVLGKMITPFKLGVGGKLGSGNQYMSWIHIKDLVSMIHHILVNTNSHRIYNGTSPEPVTNKEFTKTLGKVISRPTIFAVPSLPLKLILGEMSQLLLGGQQVWPGQFILEGFEYRYKSLENCLENLLD